MALERFKPRSLREVAEDDHAHAKRRQFIGERSATKTIVEALERILYPKQFGAATEFDRSILLSMSDADLDEIGARGAQLERLKRERDRIALAVAKEGEPV